MKSGARERLTKLFKEIPVGTKFQLVNRIMGGAMPTSYHLQKIALEENYFNAIRLDIGLKVRVRDDNPVEFILGD